MLRALKFFDSVTLITFVIIIIIIIIIIINPRQLPQLKYERTRYAFVFNSLFKYLKRTSEELVGLTCYMYNLNAFCDCHSCAFVI